MTKENSFVAQRMISSASRDRSTASIAATKENSATTSREAVASIEFSAATDEPSSAATACRIQAERRAGQRARAVRAERGARDPSPRSRSRSRVSGPAVREQVMREQHRLRVLQVRAPRHRRRRGAVRPARPAPPQLKRLDRRAPGPRRAGTSGSAWRSGRCGSGRPAAVHPARHQPARAGPAPARCARPRRRGRRRAAPEATSASSESSPSSSAAQLAVGQQTGPVQHAGVSRRAGDVVAGQPPVELGGHRQGAQRVGRAAREPAAPQPGRLAGADASAHQEPLWSRRAAIRLGSPHSCTNPLARLWSNVSPVS